MKKINNEYVINVYYNIGILVIKYCKLAKKRKKSRFLKNDIRVKNQIQEVYFNLYKALLSKHTLFDLSFCLFNYSTEISSLMSLYKKVVFTSNCSISRYKAIMIIKITLSDIGFITNINIL